ncbi:hypothetical protein J2Y45_003122 [Dyadobacter sp. BE34]|uniref:Uncharacterized protein n=1 Tax=Dyadobacter fermentans TaxID=94254 RepID=A0ABU1QTU7_9BACT|nr:hypothetical protein [Dyadobacter fermentans]MDR7043671.1 hypothetical protein [Dyadobacter sp. BE242]MDR7197983.1 hypothetical protein [Dyadobacter sp. BE34]MDR7214583.1 hypothetical protein [Dyadobacter sp. BE31]MDR7262118.1 hypothetical protein [Dyadobacter sp. BE32]
MLNSASKDEKAWLKDNQAFCFITLLYQCLSGLKGMKF